MLLFILMTLRPYVILLKPEQSNCSRAPLSLPQQTLSPRILLPELASRFSAEGALPQPCCDHVLPHKGNILGCSPLY